MSEYDPNYVQKKSFAIVGQKAIVLNAENKLLLLQRSEKSGNGGKWSVPGGALEFSEEPLAGIEREIEEETQLKVSSIQPYHVKSYINQDGDFVVIIGYLCKAETDQVKLNWEHDNFQWLTKDEALKHELTTDGLTFIENFPLDKE